MRRALLLSTVTALIVATPAQATTIYVGPPPDRKPLGVLVREAKSIHVLEELFGGVGFRNVATLKGKPAEPPFLFVEPRGDVDAFGKGGQPVICFRFQELAILHVGGKWLLARPPERELKEKHWSCERLDGFSVCFDGTTEALRAHIAVIVAGRQTTITARTPRARSERGVGRLWRIKAGLEVTDFVLSDESPHFVGWGTGESDEVKDLARTLTIGKRQDRIVAAADLAFLGSSAKPALRRALKDADNNVVLAAAKALARIDPDDQEGVATIREWLLHLETDVQVAAANALADLGPRASAALPALVNALGKSEERRVRAAAAAAIGFVAQGEDTRAAANRLIALVNARDSEAHADAIHSLRSLGPEGHRAIPIFRDAILRKQGFRHVPAHGDDAVALLARFDPPPVELLASLLVDKRSDDGIRQEAVRQLGALGPRSRIALPVLHRVLRDPQDDVESFGIGPSVAKAILDIDSVDGPSQVVRVLVVSRARKQNEFIQFMPMLGRCGAVARPHVSMLVNELSPDDPYSAYGARSLIPLLTPDDRELLPVMRKHLSGPESNALWLAQAEYNAGFRKESLPWAARCLNDDRIELVIESARWLGERGREAQVIEPELKRALQRTTGATQARIALTLWHVGEGEKSPGKTRALEALEALLAICEGDNPAVGEISPHAFWSSGEYYAGQQEDASVGAAVGMIHERLNTGDDPVTILSHALKDKSPHIRLVAAISLARVESRHAEVVPAFQRLLERYPRYFRYSADTLATLGPLAAALGPRVASFRLHPDDSVCRAAGRVLKRIDPVLGAKSWGSASAPDAVPKDLGPLWDDLASADALSADMAVWRLAGAGPRAVALLRERLRPPTAPTAEHIAKLIAGLDSSDFPTRQRATRELSEAIEPASPALRQALAGKPPLEQRRRIEELLAGFDPMRTPEQRRRLRSVRLLEEMGCAEAQVLLKKLSEGDKRFALTVEAAGASRRLERP